MKALTLYQPWASLIACGAKHIETRSWPTTYRGPLAIHAGKKVLPIEQMGLVCLPTYEPYMTMSLPLGSVVAICKLVDCREITFSFRLDLSQRERDFGDYTPGRFAWILEDVKPFYRPFPATGHQGLWEWVQPLQGFTDQS